MDGEGVSRLERHNNVRRRTVRTVYFSPRADHLPGVSNSSLILFNADQKDNDRGWRL